MIKKFHNQNSLKNFKLLTLHSFKKVKGIDTSLHNLTIFHHDYVFNNDWKQI